MRQEINLHHHVKKHRFILATVALIVVIILAVLIIEDTPIEKTYRTETHHKNIEAVTHMEVHPDYLVYLTYPQTENDDINTTIDDDLDEWRDYYQNEFKIERTSLESEDYISNKPRLEMNLNFFTRLASKDLYIFEYNEFEHDLEGRVLERKFSEIYNREDNEEVYLDEIFREDSNYLERLSEITRKELLKETPDEIKADWEKKITERTEPKIENFEDFIFEENDTLSIVFRTLEVAPYEEGMKVVHIPFDDLKDIYNDDFVKALERDHVPSPKPDETDTAAEDTPPDPDSARDESAQHASREQSENIDCSVEKCIALTFDDGPGADTARLLDYLKESNAHATFFMLGPRVASQAGNINRMVSEGHQLGNHTWSHLQLTTLPPEQISSEIQTTSTAIFNVSGKYPTAMRPPYGAVNEAVQSNVGLPIIIWNVDPRDWADRDCGIVHERVLATATPGSIILSHDIHPTTVDAYQQLIPELVAQGYSLVTVSTLLGITDPADSAGTVFYKK